MYNMWVVEGAKTKNTKTILHTIIISLLYSLMFIIEVVRYNIAYQLRFMVFIFVLVRRPNI